MSETIEELAERVARKAIRTIETDSFDQDMSLREAQRICLLVATELRDRANQFEDEANHQDDEDDA